MSKIPARNEIDPKYTWNAESVFASPEAWSAEAEKIVADIPSVKVFQGKLASSAASLADGLKAVERIIQRVEHLHMYAGFSYSVDTADQKAAAMADKAGRHPRTGDRSSILCPARDAGDRRANPASMAA